MTKPYHIDNQELLISTSIGITLFPSDGREILQLIKQASIAVRQAKYLGATIFSFTAVNSPTFPSSASVWKATCAEKPDPGRTGGVLPAQTECSLSENRVRRGFGALEPSQPGMIYPSDFVNIAEESGLISEIGINVMTAACSQARIWRDAGWGDQCCHQSVGLSTRQDNEVSQVQSILTQTGLPPRLMELELTESALIENIQASAKLLERFSKMGIRLAVDDFGTGYSSFSYLRHLLFPA